MTGGHASSSSASLAGHTVQCAMGATSFSTFMTGLMGSLLLVSKDAEVISIWIQILYLVRQIRNRIRRTKGVKHEITIGVYLMMIAHRGPELRWVSNRRGTWTRAERND